MDKYILNFDDFNLSFFKDSEDNSEDIEGHEDEELDSYLIKENMESKIPKSAIFLGMIDTEVSNWTSWVIEDDYYILQLKGPYDWAIFRISWDDNFRTWNWSSDVRMKGFPDDYKEASKIMLKELWKNWDIDLNDPEGEGYLDLLNEI